jgi:hypothetical protein
MLLLLLNNIHFLQPNSSASTVYWAQATHQVQTSSGGGSISNSGPVQCCATLHEPRTPEAENIITGLVGLVVKSITAQVGLEWNPIILLGQGGGASWYNFSSFLLTIIADEHFSLALLPPFAASRTISVRPFSSFD